MNLLAQSTYSIKRIPKENYRFDISPETISLPSKADGSDTDYSTAKANLKLSYDGKEIYPNYDERLEDEIGGRNLWRYSGHQYLSKAFVYFADNNKVDIKIIQGYTSFWFNESFSGTFRIASTPVKPLATYTYSFVAFLDEESTELTSRTMTFNAYFNGTSNAKSFTISTKPTRFDLTFTSFENTTYTLPHISGGTTGVVMADFKLVEGNKSTDWTPAPEDLDAQINDALIKQNCEATVVNGVLSVTGLTANAGYVDIPIDYGIFKQTKRLTLAKSKQGNTGADGKSITLVDVEYGKSANAQTQPTAWTTTAPTLTGNEQLWTRTKTTYSTGDPTTTTPANITPKTGGPGADGNSITSITEWYYLSTSKTAPTGGSWSTTPWTWINGMFIWTKTVFTYSKTADTETLPIVSSEWEAINELEIGGRNLFTKEILNSGFNEDSSGLSIGGSSNPNGFRVTGGNNKGIGYVQFDNVIKSNGTYTVSFKMRGSQNANRRIVVNLASQTSTVLYAPEQNVFGKSISYTFVIDDYDEDGDNYLRFQGLTHNYYFFDDIKLEKGTKPSDWSPAPEDVQAEIDAAVIKATYWSIKASTPVIYKDSNSATASGVHTPVTVNGELRSGTTTTQGGFISIQPNGGTESTATASPRTIAPTNTEGKTSYTVRLYEKADKVKLLDTMTIPVVFKGASGVNAINAILSNEADVLPASPEGVVSDYTGSGTIIRVFEGATELTYGTGNGQYQVSASGSGINVGASSTVGNTRVYGVASNMTSDNATITFTISGKTSSGTSFSLTKVQTFAKSRVGQKGKDGRTPIKGTDYFDGKDGQDGTSQYLWVGYSNNSNGSGFDQNPANKKYIGIATTTNNSRPTGYSSYNWSLIKGADGIAGEKGSDGRTSYLHIKYSNDGTTFTANNGETVGAWIGTYVDFVEEDSMDFSKYTWNKVKGEDGKDGEDGADGADGKDGEPPKISDGYPKTQYAIGDSKTIYPAIGWGDAIIDVTESKPYLWSRQEIKYDSGDTLYTGYLMLTNITPASYMAGEWDLRVAYTRNDKSYPIVTYKRANNRPLYYYPKKEGVIEYEYFVAPPSQPTSGWYKKGDIVWYEDTDEERPLILGLYKANKDTRFGPHSSDWDNVTADYAPNGIEGQKLWEFADGVELIITEALMANFGKIGGAVFTGSKMMSEKGIDNNGNVSYNYKNYPDNFTPNIELDFIEGMLKFGKNIRFGQSEGFSVMEFYDNNGKLLYDLGPTGISKIRTTDNSFTEVYLIPLNQTTFRNALESSNAKSIYKNSTSTLPTKYYRFTSGKNAAGVLTDPFNNGKLFKSASTSSGIIPNGVYIVQSPGLLFLLDTEDGRDLIGLPGQSPYNEPIRATSPLYNKTLILYFDGKKDSEVLAYWNG